MTPEARILELAEKATDCLTDHRATRDRDENGQPIAWECYADGPCAYEPLLDVLGMSDDPRKDRFPSTVKAMARVVEAARSCDLTPELHPNWCDRDSWRDTNCECGVKVENEGRRALTAALAALDGTE